MSALDLERLRAALATAAGPQERALASHALGEALAQLAHAPQADDGPAVWVSAVCHVADKASALHWLAQIGDEMLLAEVARQGRYAEVRQAAAQRIEDGSLLEQLARSSKGNDKGVYRHCSEVLRLRREAKNRQEQGLRLAQELRALLLSAPLSVSRLLELERELAALGPAEGALAQCQALCAQASQRVRHEGEQARRLKLAQQGVQSLAGQLVDAPWPGNQAYGQWLERLRTLHQGANDLPEWPAALSATQQLRLALDQIEQQLERIRMDGERAQRCEQFLDSAGAASSDPSTAQALAQAWATLALPQHATTRQLVEQRWSALVAAAAPAAPVPAQVAPSAEQAAPCAPIDAQALRAQINELESAVDQGQLADADAAAKRIKTLVGAAPLERRVEVRLQRSLARLGELRGWAKWGATKQREQLIEAAQELIGHAAGVDHISVAVPALREAWKQLNVQGPASKGQWEVFDGALEKAYQPVAAQRAQETADRAQARVHKETLLSQWESWLAALDWERVDYGAVETQLAQMQALWRSAAHAGFRDERLLGKRADALRASIEAHLGVARQAEFERRRQLISAAQALATDEDLRRATDEVKALQERWRAPPAAPKLAHGEEQKLWRQFRSACDAVFARRDAQRGEEAKRREHQAQARTQLLHDFAASLESTDAGQVKRVLTQFVGEWQAGRTSAAGARAAAGSDAQDRQARALQQRAQQRIEELRQGAYRVRLEQWRQQAPSTDGLDPAVLEQGRQARETVLMDLEIALELPSPGDSAEARRRRQLEQLQHRFRGGAQPRPDPEKLLAQWHAIAANTDAGQEQRLAVVMEKLIARNANGA